MRAIEGKVLLIVTSLGSLSILTFFCPHLQTTTIRQILPIHGDIQKIQELSHLRQQRPFVSSTITQYSTCQGICFDNPRGSVLFNKTSTPEEENCD